MKKLILLIIGILISVSTFSQTTSKDITSNPVMIKDSTGLTLMAFNEEQVTIIIKELKEAKMNKRLINELEKQVGLFKQSNKLLMDERDTLKRQIQTYIEIKMNLEGQVSIQQKKIEELNKNIEDYIKIEQNLRAEIEEYKGKIKKKNGWIAKLAVTNILTAALLIIIIL